MQDERLFDVLRAISVMISLESKPPRAKGTQTAAELQVGQRGSTELGRNSCPLTPWDIQSAHRTDGSGVLYEQQHF